MISRRSFLIGSGSLLTSTFVEKATWYLEEKQSVVPLIEPNKSLNKLYFVPLSDEYELRLGSPDLNNESFRKMTNREVLEEVHGVSVHSSLSDFRYIFAEFGVRPKMLDQFADPMCYVDYWGRVESPKAQAYRYLEKFNLFNSDQQGGLRRGDLQFMDGPCPGSDYLGVVSNDSLTASLLQARLLELGEKTSVEIISYD